MTENYPELRMRGQSKQKREVRIMTRKDYQIIARAFKANKPAENWANKHIQWSGDVIAIAHELARENERFDFAKFYSACGVDCGPEKEESND